MGVNMIDMDKAIEEAKAELMLIDNLKRPGESRAAYSALRVFRDLGMEEA
jgi:hypothetical protein